jgi:hypothetical protein
MVRPFYLQGLLSKLGGTQNVYECCEDEKILLLTCVRTLPLASPRTDYVSPAPVDILHIIKGKQCIVLQPIEKSS